jgi:hypothetical protein
LKTINLIKVHQIRKAFDKWKKSGA